MADFNINDEAVRMRHFDEIGDVLARWREDDGMSGSEILTRLVTITMSALEASGISCEDACGFVKHFYSLPTVDVRHPKVKA